MPEGKLSLISSWESIQSIELEKDILESSLLVTVKQLVIWSSDLHDWNKVLETNMYVNACMEY